MRNTTLIQWLAPVLLLATPISQAQSALIAGSEFLSDWNLIVFNNLDSRAGIEGKAFVGGEARYREDKDKEAGKDDDAKAAEIHEAKLKAEDGKGSDPKGGDYSAEINRQREELLERSLGLSKNLEALTATDKALIEENSLRIKSGEKQTVVDLSLDDFAKIGEISLAIPDGSTLVLNISGKSGTIGGKFDTSGIGKDSQVIWNFFEAERLDLESAFFGTLLSPNADVRNDNTVQGTLVASSLDQRGALRMGNVQNYQQDSGSVQTISVAPEPASWLMLILGFGLVGGALRRAPLRSRLRAA